MDLGEGKKTVETRGGILNIAEKNRKKKPANSDLHKTAWTDMVFCGLS